MAQKLDVIYNDKNAQAVRQNLKKALQDSGRNAVVQRVAHVWQGRMVRRTPKRWTGTMRRSWRVVQVSNGVFTLLTTQERIMRFLELGTKAHGPSKAKRLFIPLTRRAAQAGARGVMYALKAWSLAKTFGASNSKKKPPFIMFKDFVWSKRVKGIKAAHFIEAAKPQAMQTLKTAMIEYIERVLR